MSRAIPWSRENFASNDVRYLNNAYLQQTELSLSALKASHKTVSTYTSDDGICKQTNNKNTCTAAEELRTPDEDLDATEDLETMVYDLSTTADDLTLLGFVVMQSGKEKEIADYYYTQQKKRQHSSVTDVNIDSREKTAEINRISRQENPKLSTNTKINSVGEYQHKAPVATRKQIEKNEDKENKQNSLIDPQKSKDHYKSRNANAPENGDKKNKISKNASQPTEMTPRTSLIDAANTDKRRVLKRNRETNSGDCITRIGDLGTSTGTTLANTDNCITENSATETALSIMGDSVTGESTTSTETLLSLTNVEDLFTEDFLSDTGDLFSNAEDFLSDIDDLTMSPENVSTEIVRFQLEQVKEQIKTFEKAMEENNTLTQKINLLSSMPHTNSMAAETLSTIKAIIELSQRMRDCTTTSLLNLASP